MQRTKYNKISYDEMTIFIFFISNNDNSQWLNTPYGILCNPVKKKISEPLLNCLIKTFYQ